MQTRSSAWDWFKRSATVYSAPGLGKYALFESTPKALCVQATTEGVLVHSFHTDHDWAVLEPEEARQLAANLVHAADALEAVRNRTTGA